MKGLRPCSAEFAHARGSLWARHLRSRQRRQADGHGMLGFCLQATTWKYNRDVDIIVSGLNEETDYPYIYCYAEAVELKALGPEVGVL